MENLKIYISLEEAEQLVFNRIVILSPNRLEVKRAQASLSVSISIKQELLIANEADIVILFSAVDHFEIPEKDEILFTNHYKVPLGLLVLNSRNVRDVEKENTLFDDEIATPVEYLKLRNGLLGIYFRAYQVSSKGLSQRNAVKVIEEFSGLSEFKSMLISDLSSESTFPVLKIKTDNFVTDNYFRVVWWAKRIVDTYAGSLSEKPEKLGILKKWVKEFFQFNDLDLVNQQLSEAPKILNPEINFLAGYFFASAYYETLIGDENYTETLFEKLKFDNKDEVFSWITFFVSFYDPKVTQLYPVKSYLDDVYKLERIAYYVSNKSNSIEDPLKIEMPNVERKKLIAEYLDLNEGGTNNPEIIKEEEAKSVFENYLFGNQIRSIGLEFEAEYVRNNKVVNSFWTTKERFKLVLGSEIDPSKITFYTSHSSSSTEKLKQLKLKVMPAEKLIEKKKVLVGFIDSADIPSLLSVYNSILKEAIEKRFDKAVFILLVNLEVSKIQSIEFNNFLKTREVDLQRLFDIPIEIVVKNERQNNDLEVKRNVKNILKGYKMNQIEVVDENFDTTKASWILGSSTEYFIDDGKRLFGFVSKAD